MKRPRTNKKRLHAAFWPNMNQAHKFFLCGLVYERRATGVADVFSSSRQSDDNTVDALGFRTFFGADYCPSECDVHEGGR
jgi:hypothetical protein